MEMEPEEIRERFKKADDKKKQIGILAELNAVPKEKICKVLLEGPFLPSEENVKIIESALTPKKKYKRKVYPPTNFDRDNAKHLWEQGMSDKEIADEMNETQERVGCWRRTAKLKSNTKRKAEPSNEEIPMEAEPMLAGDLAELIANIARMDLGAEVYLPSGELLRGITVNVRYRTNEDQRVEVLLE